MRITFLRDEIYETEGPNRGTHFPRGCVVDCVEEFGLRWLNRGAAEQTGRQVPKGDGRWEIVSLPKAGEISVEAAETPRVLTPRSARPPAKSSADRAAEKAAARAKAAPPAAPSSAETDPGYAPAPAVAVGAITPQPPTGGEADAADEPDAEGEGAPDLLSRANP